MGSSAPESSLSSGVVWWGAAFRRLSSSQRKFLMEGIFIASSISSRLNPGPWICRKTSKRESPLLLIRRPRASLWVEGGFTAFSVPSLAVAMSGRGGAVVQVSALMLVACVVIFSFSTGILGCGFPGGSVVSGVVLVMVTEIAGVSRVAGERAGTVTCTVVVDVRGILPSLASASIWI